MSINELELDEIIESCRKEMISVGMSKGLTSSDTIQLSQMLDTLLNKKMGS